jgi:acyl-CoA reductase-like NAD-dependent aldehyde dehydrogenase
MLNDDEYAKVCKILTRGPGKINPGIVGRAATKIADMAGVAVPADTRVLCYLEKGVGNEYPFSLEKLSPCLGVYFEEDWQAACQRCIQLLTFGGVGHSLVIHSTDEEVIRQFALKKPVSRLLVNTPSSQGAVGGTTNLFPSFTLGCGSVGGSATSDNVSPLNLINIRRVAYGTQDPWDNQPAACCEKEVDTDAIAKLVIAALKEM